MSGRRCAQSLATCVCNQMGCAEVYATILALQSVWQGTYSFVCADPVRRTALLEANCSTAGEQLHASGTQNKFSNTHGETHIKNDPSN